MMYEMSSAMAVSENIALAATGDANWSRPGRMENAVVPKIALIGVLVYSLMRPKKPLSGRPAIEPRAMSRVVFQTRMVLNGDAPWSRLKA